MPSQKLISAAIAAADNVIGKMNDMKFPLVLKIHCCHGKRGLATP
jgi:hypothetical protein